MLTPEPYRDPPTRKVLAADLQNSYSYAKQIKATIPKDVKKFLRHGDMLLAVRWPEIARAVAEKAETGSKDHAQMARAVKEDIQGEREDDKPPEHSKAIMDAFHNSPVYKIALKRK